MSLSNYNAQCLPNQRIIDFDLHGIVGVRLIDPTVSDTGAIAGRWGAPRATHIQDPDIVIHFQHELSTPGLRYLGLNSTGFTDEGFYVLGRKSGEVEARIPFEKIGNQCEIVCRSGLSSVPLLSDIIRFTFLKKNYIPLHASAFLFNGVGVLATGWTKGGKTETLLSFANHGACYVGDEWVILSSDGQEMFGMPIPICIWDWQFKHIPHLMPEIGIQKKILFNSVYFLDRIHRTFGRGRWENSFMLRELGEALPAFKRQLNIRKAPHEIFGDRICKQGATLDKVFLMMSYCDTDIRVETRDPLEIARRMVNSNESEQMPFFEYYKAFKFAFPNRQNEFLEKVEELQYTLLSRALEGKEAYEVLHPYPVSFEALFNHVQPYCQSTVPI